jgi:hypothetical protein
VSELEAAYEEMGAQLAKAMAKSRRQTKFTYMAAVAKGWTEAETAHYVETGGQPAGKEFDQA